MEFSRRDFLAGSALALGAGVLAKTTLVRAFQNPPQPQWTPVFTEIRRNIGFYTGRGGTIGYLIDKGGVAVVDSQFPDAAKACLDGLQERSKGRGVDVLINTHHHGDHTAGNVAFKGATKRIVAHVRAVELQKEVAAAAAAKLPAGTPAPEVVHADRTFTDQWREQYGDEWIRAKFYGRAHTSGDAIITFERANVAHMGDLMFNRRHPVVDRPAGASMKNWISVLEMGMKDHSKDTIYIFGHSGPQPASGNFRPGEPFPVTGPSADVMYFRDYLTALLAFVQSEIKAGKSREDVTAIRTPLKGFETHGALTANILGNAFDDVSAG